MKTINMFSVKVEISKVEPTGLKVEIKNSFLQKLNIIHLNGFCNRILLIVDITVTELTVFHVTKLTAILKE